MSKIKIMLCLIILLFSAAGTVYANFFIDNELDTANHFIAKFKDLYTSENAVLSIGSINNRTSDWNRLGIELQTPSTGWHDMGFNLFENDKKISGSMDSTSSKSIPVPTAMLLLGIGLIGFTATSWNRVEK